MGANLAIQKSNIKATNNTIDDLPKYFYTPVLKGQVNYILKECKEQGIRAELLLGDVHIYSERKVQTFQEIILRSLSDNFTYRTDDMKRETQSFHLDKKFICLAIKSKDLILTTEQAFDNVIYYQFLGKIPVAKNYKIYSTYGELVDKSETDFNIVI